MPPKKSKKGSSTKHSNSTVSEDGSGDRANANDNQNQNQGATERGQRNDNINNGDGDGDFDVLSSNTNAKIGNNDSSFDTTFSNSNDDSEVSQPEELVVVSASLNVNTAAAGISFRQSIENVNLEDEDEIEEIQDEIAEEDVIEVNISGGGQLLKQPAEQDIVAELPPTVTVLTKDSSKVYLVGTAHFSEKSQEDVRKTIQLVKPNKILLELCYSRRNILQYDEEMLLREAGDIGWAKIRDTLQSAPPNSSKIQSLLHLVLLSMSANLTKKLGMAPGGEFRAAVQEGRKLDKCMIILGDRPFNITLQRAIHSLTIRQKIKLGWQFLWANSDDITKEEIEKCKERDLLEKMLLEMTGEFPSITEVFVNERDIFLAQSLWLAAEENTRVVGVVGMGHVPGITKWFGHSDEAFREIADPPPKSPPSLTFFIVKSAVKLTLYGTLLYGAYKFFNRFDIVSKLKIVKV